MKISAAEVESLVQSHPAVAEVAAVAAPDERLGERTVLFVTPKPGATLTLADLIEHLRRQQVAAFKLPEQLELVAALPRNPVGKVQKTLLRDQARQGRPGPGA